MTIVGWILLGASFGIVGKLLLTGSDPNSALVPPVLGIMGAVIGGVASESAVGALLGAIGLVLLYGFTTGRVPAVLDRR
jgi:uncharacterized membrane protein YeaQ/YmgE (transglycosylase-associated protein family)